MSLLVVAAAISSNPRKDFPVRCIQDAAQTRMSHKALVAVGVQGGVFFSAVLPMFSSQPSTHSERRVVRFPPEKVFEVVSRVQDYTKFIPWCRDARILVAPKVVGSTEVAAGQKKGSGGVPEGPCIRETMSAQLEVGFQGLSEKYTSRVTLTRPALSTPEASSSSSSSPASCSSSILVEAEDSGMFEVLKSSWIFRPGPSPSSCWVEFKIDFAFRNPIYNQLASGFKEEVAKTMIGAFERRCQQLYATPSGHTAQGINK
mmetsp:Transcript_66997/g.56877  ORF Transcript_66997/g.56877 Transcript_66997/m.56877 type:complete len:259 (-) Transcript_66997:267-1043(-)